MQYQLQHVDAAARDHAWATRRVNDGKGAPHNWQLPNLPVGDWVPLTVAGQSAQVTFTAPAPGTYQFVCSIHLRQGQTGELIVLPN